MEKTHIEIETNIMVKECVLYMQPYDNLPPRLPPCCPSRGGLVDDRRDRLRKIKFVGGGGNAENVKSALCGL